MRRRQFLIAAPAGVLAACGEAAKTDAPAGDRADLALLRPALELERSAIVLYRTGAELAAAGNRVLLARLLEHEEDHAHAIRNAIEDLRGRPPAARPDDRYRGAFPALRDEPAFLRFAREFERRTVEAYAAALPRVKTQRLRGLLGSLLAAEAGHASALAEAAGGDPLERMLALPA